MKSIQHYITEKLKITKSNKYSYKYFPSTNKELKNIINKLLMKNLWKDVINLNSIDTSQIIDMSNLFNGMEELLKIDISYWNVSNVKNMDSMFAGCTNLEKIVGIEDWDVSNVKNMESMFEGCESFNQDISNWNVHNVKEITAMFKDCAIEEKYKPKFS